MVGHLCFFVTGVGFIVLLFKLFVFFVRFVRDLFVVCFDLVLLRAKVVSGDVSAVSLGGELLYVLRGFAVTLELVLGDGAEREGCGRGLRRRGECPGGIRALYACGGGLTWGSFCVLTCSVPCATCTC